MLPAFGAPHEMRWHSFVQYLNMPSILAWHLRHLPQIIGCLEPLYMIFAARARSRSIDAKTGLAAKKDRRKAEAL
jgi:hypothetical protein